MKTALNSHSLHWTRHVILMLMVEQNVLEAQMSGEEEFSA
jgi:hypothetical protein